MNDNEKSVLLAKAMGVYEVVGILAVVDALVDGDRKHYWQQDGVVQEIPDLYDPANMALAWRVHLWAWRSAELVPNYRYRKWCLQDSAVFAFEDAQRRWLDKIVELIEAEPIEVSDA